MLVFLPVYGDGPEEDGCATYPYVPSVRKAAEFKLKVVHNSE
jgi:hypothetical protein